MVVGGGRRPFRASLSRLVEDLWHVDPARARRLVARSALLAPVVSLTGQVSPVLPATAAAHEQGAIDDEHLRVIASTTELLARIPGLDPETYADADRSVVVPQAAPFRERGGPPADELRRRR